MSEYDYSIVGAGSAGCVLAEGLTSDPRHRVLVLEAGGSDGRFWIRVPLGYAFAHRDPTLTVACEAEPDEGLALRRAVWPRGRVLGGCSSVNAMTYMRGLPHDFEDWAASGARGWDWPAVRATFQRLEAGPVHVGDLSADMHPFAAHFLRAARELQWPILDDLNLGYAGIGRYRSTVRAGRRWSAADAFLRPALRRRGLRVELRAQVERVLVEDGVAVGVAYRQRGRLHLVRARREVILSAGAVHTPQLLQLSGIGPGALLQSHGIPVVNAQARVGRGLQDHLAITYSFAARAETLNTVLGDRIRRIGSGLHYLATRRGPLSVPVNQVGGYVATDGGAPDVQLYCNPIVYSMGARGPHVGRAAGYILSAQPCRPTSRGRIEIRSPEVTDEPLIQPDSLRTPEDRRGAVRAGRILAALSRTETLRQVCKEAIGPDPARLDDAMLLDDFRRRAGTVFHPCCTCAMGDDPARSALDPRLRVRGMGRLRVVDASAFPNITSGNTNAPTLMLAARAAEIILEDNH